MANSKIKQILVGTTTYDIEDAGAAHLSVTNTFTGTNEFRGYAAQFLTRAAAANDPHITVGAHEIRCYSGEISNPNLVVFQRELKNIWQSLKSKPPKEI